MLQQLATACKETAHRIAVPPLQDIVSAGEALLFTPELQHLLDRLPDCKLHNHYGPTESHVITSHLVTDRDLRSLRESPIGKPISNSQVYVLDAQRKPLPPGIPGDLWLAGDCLAHGYVDRPEWTESRFMHVSLPLVGTKRMYQSGDTARWNNHGELLYLGRSDDQVKHRGVRIELGEIEARLLEHPGIAQAAVAIQSTSDGLQRLCAYYVVRDGVPASHGDLQAFLRQRLPDAMIPNAWAALESLPLTASGKLNRRALPIDIAWQTDSMEYVPPCTPMESALAEIWMELLKVERVGATDHFFALGGHSLMAARMRSRLMHNLGCNIPLRQIFEFPVLRDLANSLEVSDSDHASRVSKDLIPRTGATRGPLSCSQARLWFLESLSGGVSNTYNLNYACKLLGALDANCLRQCFEEWIARHQILRTRYVQEEGEILQEVLDSVPIDWHEEHLDSVSPEDALSRCESILSARSQHVFDLTRGEVVRATLVKCDPEVHVFSITIHHIAFDGGSISIFLQELSDSYRHRRHGQPMQTPDATLQYLDYAIWQRSSLADPSIEESLEFWKTSLKGLKPLELPQDTPCPEEATNHGDSVPLYFDREVVAALKQLGQSCNATLQMTLMASFQMLLGRIAGTDDLAVGTATANRNMPQLEQLVGFIANTVLVRTKLDWNTSFRELLQRVQRTSLDVYAHEDLPFDYLVEHLHPDRASNRLPLVQALLQVLPSEVHTLQLPGIAATEFPVGVTSSRFELEAHLWEHDDELTGFLVYSTDLFQRSRMQALADRWSSLIHQISKDPNRKLGEFDVLLPREREPLLMECNQTQRDLPAGSVAEVFQDVAERFGQQIALIDGEQSWSYEELNRASDRWAAELQQRGVRTGDAVAMLLPRSPQMIVAMLAILKAGGCYVPLSPEDPPQRLAFLLQRSQAALVLTDDSHGVPLPQIDIPTLAMNSTEPLGTPPYRDEKRPVGGQSDARPQPHDLAYVLFTSGSTGEPKGVCVEHRSILRLVFGNDYAKFGPDRVLLQLAPAAFDAATFEVWGALLHGATLVLAPPDRVPDLATIGSLIQKHRVTTLWLTATLFNQWIEEAPESLRSVEEILTGGEALSVPHIRMAQQRLGPSVQLINGYGPTECTTFATCYRIPFPLQERVRSIPIGRPIGNTMAWVVDERLNLVPPGTVGELLLGGQGLARGYLANDAMTQSRFIPAPWPEVSGERAYRTGDLVRWNAEGNLEFLGRMDDQVKLRGFRIELGEIESHLMTHPDVQRCVVIITEDAHQQSTLAAYIVPSDANHFAPTEIREHLRERLPSYMVPTAYVSIDHIPIKENGKVDAKRLPPIDANTVLGSLEAVPPRNETERQMLELWMDVLGKTGFGVMDGFFDLGGHSLLAVKLFAKIEKQFGVKLPLAVLFQHATVAQLADQLSKATNKTKWVDIIPLSEARGDHPLYLFPSLGGELLHLRPLVDAMEGSISIVGLQPILSEEYVALARDLQATAAKFVEAIQTRQPHGPYRLAGFSYGGMLAFEVARQLSRSGEKVDYLAILDTGPCRDGQPMQLQDQFAWGAAVLRNLPGWIVCEWKHTPWSVIVSSAKRKGRFAIRWLRSLGKAKTTYDDIFESPRIASRDVSILRSCFEAFAKYITDMTTTEISQHGRYAGPLHVFRTRIQALMSGAQNDLGWSRCAVNVNVHLLPGNHEMVFTHPSLEELANELERGLRQLDSPSEQQRRS
ncbi:MAG: amino acid adenylation domain-containing protein [Pirellula sp.]